ncbi:OsmC family protein [Oceanobacillus jeddahense]|uniref:OsmC family protein n=1 Tax=Oceanobacillus jeddahense TaxID=1462527 RepID=A0ABY5JMJ2_9BACI|nr:OsmC family protein [Oceanobacillus jeddahense]UUI01030.1 OsmC family protein [Oceanobacillus jeddahense]
MLQFHMNEDGFQTSVNYGDLQVSSQDENGYRPYEMMVSSVAGCSGLVLKRILEKMRIPFSNIQVTASMVRNPDIANRIEKMDLTFTVISTDASDKKLEKALELTHKNCGMIQSVKDSILITESIHTA